MCIYIFYPLFGYPVGAEAEVHSAIFIQFYEDFALFCLRSQNPKVEVDRVLKIILSKFLISQVIKLIAKYVKTPA